jgi:hypothetical protein
MSKRKRLRGGRKGGRATGWVLAVAATIVLVCVALAAGCTSESGLVRILSTEVDSNMRQEAAADLAPRHSVEATQQLAAAAESDAIAAAGLDALAEAYGAVLEEGVRQATETGDAKPIKETILRLKETVACLGYMGTPKATAVLGAFVCLDGEYVPGLKELQVASLDILGDQGSEEAIAELIRVGCSLGKGPYARSLAFAARKALCGVGGSAAGPLVAVAESEEWARETLVDMGSDSVPTLLDVLGDEKWTEAVLARMGGPAIEAVFLELGSSEETVVHRALGVLLRMYEKREPGLDHILLVEGMVPVLLADLMNAAFGPENFDTKAEGFDHVFAAESALAEIGEPAIEQVLSSSYRWKWRVLQIMGSEAVPRLMSTMTSSNREESLEAATTLARMAESSPGSVQPLMDALEQEDMQYVATNYLYYIALGKDGTEDLITDALLKHGTRDMARDCLNCGNETLEAAAITWASKRGSHAYERRSRRNPRLFLSWGCA